MLAYCVGAAYEALLEGYCVRRLFVEGVYVAVGRILLAIVGWLG